LYCWAGSALLATLAWYELRPVSVAVAWMVGGLVLLEIGVARKSLSWRFQAYFALFSAFLRIFFVNLNAGGDGINPRIYTVVPIALAFFYSYWRLRDSSARLAGEEQRAQIPELFCWLGTISLTALLRFELLPDWVATGWAALALLLIGAAYFSKRVFLHQALLLSVGILFRTVLHNFYQRSYFPPLDAWQSRWVLVGSTVGLMLVGLPLLFRLRETHEPVTSPGWLRRMFAGLDRHPEQLFFFIAVILLTVMLALEMRYGMVTLAWGVEGLAVFSMGLVAGERSFRLTGFGLLLLCLAKILVKDMWRLQGGDRYLTLIVLGLALVAVSFFSTRYREKILRYL
jgi:hypothetical protein